MHVSIWVNIKNPKTKLKIARAGCFQVWMLIKEVWREFLNSQFFRKFALEKTLQDYDVSEKRSEASCSFVLCWLRNLEIPCFVLFEEISEINHASLSVGARNSIIFILQTFDFRDALYESGQLFGKTSLSSNFQIYNFVWTWMSTKLIQERN